MHRAPLSPSSALVAHIEPALSGAHVLFIGDPKSRIASHLLSRGARHVHVSGRDDNAVNQASGLVSDRNVSFSTLPVGALPNGTFDVIVVENLGEHGRPSELIRLVRQALGHRGIAVIATENDDASSGILGARQGRVDYDTFNSLLEEHFESAIVIAQSPFVGYALVDLSAEGPISPVLDNGYLHGAADVVDYFVGVAGPHAVLDRLALAPMSIVQLEATDIVPSKPAAPVSTAKFEKSLLEKDEEIARLLRQTSELETRAKLAEQAKREALDKLRAQSTPVEPAIDPKELQSLRATVDKLEARVTELTEREEKFEREKVEIYNSRRAVEQDARRFSEEAKRLAAKVKEQEDELYDLDDALHEAEEKLKAAEAKPSESPSEREAREARVKAAEIAAQKAEAAVLSRDETIAKLRKDLAASEARDKDAFSKEISRFEEQLLERGRTVSELERALSDLGTYSATLRAEIEQLRARGESTETAGLARDLEELSRRLAEKEADLVAAEWTISTLQKGTSPEKRAKSHS